MARIGNHTFFFHKESPFSNWYPASFVVKGVTFCCVEQFMMYCKAKLFKDERIAESIMLVANPAHQKALGRQIKGFDEKVWMEKREKYVFVGCYEKFRQNPHLLRELLATDCTVLVEASPYDRIWGVGLAENDPRILEEKNWRGENLLGRILGRVREEFLREF
ncbi:MAG: NADAR family protein [Geobacter sp.]|nr:MAG: NADAR family protein [Geobacter sp.]